MEEIDLSTIRKTVICDFSILMLVISTLIADELVWEANRPMLSPCPITEINFGFVNTGYLHRDLTLQIKMGVKCATLAS